ncbi:unnamed protein product, partial [Oppiella nova]
IVSSVQEYDSTTGAFKQNRKVIILEILEGLCVGWFTLEYGLRLIAAPNKYRFLKGALNIIDLLAIVPYFGLMLLNSSATKESTQWSDLQRLLLALRCVRILRVLRLGRHSHGLRVLGQTLLNSGRELGLLALSVAIAIIIFSTLAYYAEKDVPETLFTSIPSTFWWACITMTTVGYGDVVPATMFGKAVAVACCMSGVVVVALPIPIMVTKFTELYKKQLRRERTIQHREVVNSGSDKPIMSGKIQKRYDSLKLEVTPISLAHESQPPVSQHELHFNATGADNSHTDPTKIDDKTGDQKVILNIGGVKHVVMRRSLERLPLTRLGRLRESKAVVSELCDDYNLTDNEYYFDRNNTTFEPILALYRTDSLHLTEAGVPECLISRCCQRRYHQRKQQLLDDIRDDEEYEAKHIVDSTGPSSTGSLSYQQRLWRVLDKPYSSPIARILSVVSILFTIVSTVVVIMSSMEMLWERIQLLDFPKKIGNYYYWRVYYGLQLIAAPNKYRFLKGALNVIDLWAILPYYGLMLGNTSQRGYTYWQDIQRKLLILRCVRILRVLRLGRHSYGLRVLGQMLLNSGRELELLALSVAIAIIIFSTQVYYAEKDEVNTKFRSIPGTFWWACITMTTVGYGDVVPTTMVGKAWGIVCCMSGVVVIALPIPIMVTKFNELYKKQLRRERDIQHKEFVDSDSDKVVSIQLAFKIKHLSTVWLRALVDMLSLHMDIDYMLF